MKKVVFLMSFLLSATVAQASESMDSPAMRLAKRVAAMENQRDLPSRAVWLSHRVAKNSRDLAYTRTKGSKNSKPAPSMKN